MIKNTFLIFTFISSLTASEKPIGAALQNNPDDYQVYLKNIEQNSDKIDDALKNKNLTYAEKQILKEKALSMLSSIAMLKKLAKEKNNNFECKFQPESLQLDFDQMALFLEVITKLIINNKEIETDIILQFIDHYVTLAQKQKIFLEKLSIDNKLKTEIAKSYYLQYGWHLIMPKNLDLPEITLNDLRKSPRFKNAEDKGEVICSFAEKRNKFNKFSKFVDFLNSKDKLNSNDKILLLNNYSLTSIKEIIDYLKNNDISISDIKLIDLSNNRISNFDDLNKFDLKALFICNNPNQKFDIKIPYIDIRDEKKQAISIERFCPINPQSLVLVSLGFAIVALIIYIRWKK